MKFRVTGTAWQETGPGDDWTFEPDGDQGAVPATDYRADTCCEEDGELDADGIPLLYNAVAEFEFDRVLDDWRVEIVELEEA